MLQDLASLTPCQFHLRLSSHRKVVEAIHVGKVYFQEEFESTTGYTNVDGHQQPQL